MNHKNSSQFSNNILKKNKIRWAKQKNLKEEEKYLKKKNRKMFEYGPKERIKN
jgi:hypothetical protein